MENGSGQASTQFFNTPFGYSPFQPNTIVPSMVGTAPICAEGDIAIPASPAPTTTAPAHKPRWYETEEGRAERGALIKAGWAKRRAAQQRAASRLAAAQKEVDSTAKAAGLDAAIEFHRNALNTLLAAKGLLK